MTFNATVGSLVAVSCESLNTRAKLSSNLQQEVVLLHCILQVLMQFFEVNLQKNTDSHNRKKPIPKHPTYFMDRAYVPGRASLSLTKKTPFGMNWSMPSALVRDSFPANLRR